MEYLVSASDSGKNHEKLALREKLQQLYYPMRQELLTLKNKDCPVEENIKHFFKICAGTIETSIQEIPKEMNEEYRSWQIVYH